MQPLGPDNRDSNPSPPASIDLKRITLPDLFGFLGRLSIGSYFIIAGAIGAIFYFGVFIQGLRNGSDGTQHLDLANKGVQQGEELNRLKLDLQVRSLAYDQLKKEKIELLEKNAEQAKALEAKKQKILTLFGEIRDLELQVFNRQFQHDFADRLQKVAYLVWVPESAALPPIYIDDKHYSLFKCMRKLFPADLLGNKGDKTFSFSVRFEKTALSDVAHLYIVSIPAGKHRITRQVSSTVHPTYEFTEEFEDSSIHLVDIDQIDIYRKDKGLQTNLRTLEHSQLISKIPSKIFTSMREDNACLREQFSGADH